MKQWNRKELSRMFLLIFIGLVSVGSLMAWINSRFHISTDNAYLNANVVQMSPRVTGQVASLRVVDNQLIHAGDRLFDLDPTAYEAELLNANAAVERVEAELSIARITAERVLELVKKRASSTQEGDIARARLKSAEANLSIAKAGQAIARLNLAYTHISAPVSGWVTHLTLRVGDVVTATRPVFALISNEGFWVDANFRETELHHIHKGQRADIRIDMYPGHLFHGVVESISAGTGAAFSLLPPENATGNWVKVTQRVPVRIRILDQEPSFPLRIGTSAKVSISLRTSS